MVTSTPPTNQALTQKKEALPYLLFALILAAGLALQVWRLGYVALWSDEYRGTLTLINLPWSNLLSGDYAWEYNPPLYFLLLKAWNVLAGGDHEISMRALSVLLYTGSLVTLYLLGKKLANWQTGLALMAAVAFHPIYLSYATQLRAYPLMLFLAALALLCTASYLFGETADRRWLIGLGLALVLSTYSHYFGISLLLAVLVITVVLMVARPDGRYKALLATLFASLVATLPVFWLFFTQYGRYSESAAALQTEYPRWGAGIFLAMLSGSMSFNFQASDPVQLLSLLAAAGGTVVLLRSGRKPLALALLAVLGLLSLTVLVLSELNYHVVPRYVIQISLLAWVLAALAFSANADRLTRLLQVVTVAAICLNGLYSVRDAVTQKTYYAPNWRAVARLVEEQVRPLEALVIMGWDAAPTAYYLDRSWLTSYELEAALEQGRPAESYLILDSQYARRLDFIDYREPLYEDPQWQVRLVRFVPGEAALPP